MILRIGLGIYTPTPHCRSLDTQKDEKQAAQNAARYKQYKHIAKAL
jgi:hypothetical protein